MEMDGVCDERVTLRRIRDDVCEAAFEGARTHAK
jgi:hypothetical protein